MEKIKKRVLLSGLATGAAFLLLFWFLLRKEYYPAGAAACIAAISAFLLAGSIRGLISAKLIVDNCIIDICPAAVSMVGKDGKLAQQTVECVFSTFGLLVDGRVYKFGRDGIRLHAVEIGTVAISAMFGSKAKCWRAEFVCEPLQEEALLRLAERVRYETGIMPSFSTQPKPTDATTN